MTENPSGQWEDAPTPTTWLRTRDSPDPGPGPSGAATQLLGTFHLLIAESLAFLLQEAETRAARSGDARQRERATFLLLKLNALIEQVRDNQAG